MIKELRQNIHQVHASLAQAHIDKADAAVIRDLHSRAEALDDQWREQLRVGSVYELLQYAWNHMRTRDDIIGFIGDIVMERPNIRNHAWFSFEGLSLQMLYPKAQDYIDILQFKQMQEHPTIVKILDDFFPTQVFEQRLQKIEAEIKTQQDAQLAIAMATHPRLGKNSSLHALEPELVRSVAREY
jgi:hypothetical protein